MKLLIIPSWYPPNGGVYLQEQFQELLNHDFQVDVLVNQFVDFKNINPVRASNFLKKKRIRIVNENGLRVIRSYYVNIPKLEKINLFRWLNHTFDLVEFYINKFGKPDLIIAHSCIWAGAVVADVYQHFKIPYILYEHRARFLENNQSSKLLDELYIPHIKNALLHAKHVVTVNEKLKKKLISLEPSVKEKHTTIPYYIDHTLFTLPPIGPELKPFIFFTLGSNSSNKGLEDILKAFHKFIFINGKNYLLKIGGIGPNKSKIENLTRKLSLANNVYSMDYLNRKEVINEMHDSHSFILASKNESFGISLFEAMSCGLPVITSKCGGPENFITNENGLLFTNGNIDELTDKMSQMVENYNLYDPVKIRNTVIDNFNKDKLIAKTIKLYRNIVENTTVS